MRKIITIIASLMLVSTVFAGGAMAHSGGHHDDGGDDGVEVEQEAEAEVEQTQVVSQSNTIDDQWGVAASVGLGGDSSVNNVNIQTNNNQQVAEVEAGNEIEYEG